jgi:hypothetical protein
VKALKLSARMLPRCPALIWHFGCAEMQEVPSAQAPALDSDGWCKLRRKMNICEPPAISTLAYLGESLVATV